MSEPPLCDICHSRHWFLDPCGKMETTTRTLASTASTDEIERALKFYRAHRDRERERARKKARDATSGGSAG